MEKRQAITDFDDAFDLALRGLLLFFELAGDTAGAERCRRVFRRPHRFRNQPEAAEETSVWSRRAPSWLASLWRRLRA